MTVRAACQELIDVYQNQAHFIALDSLYGAGIDSFLVLAFTTVNPLAGAIIGGLSWASRPLVIWAFRQVHLMPQGADARNIRIAIQIIGSAALATLATAAMGFSIPITAFILLDIAGSALYIGGSMFFNTINREL